MKKTISVILTVMMVLLLFPNISLAASGTVSSGGTYDIGTYGSGSIVTINSGLTVTLTNTGGLTYTNMQIACGAGVTLTIDGVKISNTSNNAAALSFGGSNNHLILVGQSILSSDDDVPGVKVESGTTLEISGDGELTARGGGGGAGIGAGTGQICGNITISGGTVTAYGGAESAGIGGAYNGSGGTINITGGTVRATGGTCGSGIGGAAGGSAGTINISGGNVTASGNQDGAGIGGATGDGNITISDGYVSANGDTYGAGIGGALNSSGGSIVITGGTVFGNGGDEGGAGIGGGYGGDGGTILISGDNITDEYAASGYINVCGTGSKGGAGIGGGYSGSAGSITISGSYIYAEKGATAPYDVGSGLNGMGGSLTLSGSGVLFLQNEACITPITSTHTLKTTPVIADFEAGGDKAYGFYLPAGCGTTAHVYLNESNLYDLTYDANGGSGTVPEAVTQYAGTAITVADGSALLKNSYALISWNTSSDGTEDGYTTGDEFTFAADTTLYAIYGNPFGQGDGSPDNPYGISTPEQLNAVRYFPNANFIMLNDIDMSEVTSEGGVYWNDGAGWEPIVQLNGTFDGNKHTISGLYINQTPGAALFNTINKNAIIKNLGVTDSTISGGRTAGLALTNNGSITQCFNTSNIYGYGIYAGGIVAYNYGTITECYNTGKIVTDTSFGYVGGISGSNCYIINDCYNAGLIKADYCNGIGGITGEFMHVVDKDLALVTNCYNIGEVETQKSSGCLGAIIGSSFGGDVINCYYLNNIEYGYGQQYDLSYYENVLSKSLVELKQEATFNTFNFYNTWKIIEDERFPVLKNVPFVYTSGVELDMDTLTLTGESGTLYATLNITINPNDSTDMNVAWSSSNESVATVQDGVVRGIITGTAIIAVTTQDGGFTDTCEVTVIPKGEYFLGSGTEEDPYQIRNAGDLKQLSNLINAGNTEYYDKYYMQTKDIDLSEYDSWIPIGDKSFDDSIFKGVYDGNSYKITDLCIDMTPVDSSRFYTGLFGLVKGTIKNVVLGEGSIKVTCSYDTSITVGGIVGTLQNGSSIINCTSSIDVDLSLGDDSDCSAGGIVGSGDYNSKIVECEFAGDINIIGHYINIGGIVGFMSYKVSLSNCINRGNIYSEGNTVEAGGIVGRSNPYDNNYSSSISKCFNSGDISIYVKSNLCFSGGIAGYIGIVNVSDCFNTGAISTEKYISNNYICGAGGIVGIRTSDGGLIENVYNVGFISGYRIGAIAGVIGGTQDPPDNCYYYVESCQSAFGSGVGTAESKTLSELRQQSTFVNFDFTDTWTIVEGERFPILQGLAYEYVTGISLDNETMEIYSGESAKLSVEISPSDATNKNLIWTSSNESIATVIDGNVIACSGGTAIITVLSQDGSFSDVCELSIIQSVTGVSIINEQEEIPIGDSITIDYVISPSDATNKEVIWSSSDVGVATISSTGTVYGVSKGSVEISVVTEDGSYVDTCEITVVQPVSSVSLSSNAETMTTGNSITLSATVSPSDATYSDVTWFSSNTNIATVDQTGKVTAVGVGSATITATADGVSATCNITVQPAQCTITVTSNNSYYGTVAGGGTYGKDISVTLTATPNAGCRFVCWLNGSTQVSTNTSYTFTANADMSLTAEFAPIGVPTLYGASAGYDSARLAWTAVEGAAGYEVWRSTSAWGTYSKIGTVTGTSYTDNGLSTNTPYYYKVNAYCTASTATTYGNQSVYASATPVPAAPAVYVSPTSYNSAYISWNAVPGANGYELSRATSQNGNYSVVKTTSSLSYTNTSLGTGTTYYYRVRAYRMVGRTKVWGDYSAITSATPMLSSVASASASAYYPTSVKVSWSAVPGRTRYEVWRSTSPDSGFALIKSTTSTYYKDTTCTPFVTYYYQIKVHRTVNRQPIYSASVSPTASATPVLGNVAGVKAAVSSPSSIKISWASVTGASGYEVLRSTTIDGEYVSVKSTSGRSFTDNNLIPNTTYYYQVRAYRKVGGGTVPSVPSAPVSATPYFGSVTSPKAVRSSETKIKLTWKAVSGRTGYEIYRSASPDGGFVQIKSTTSTSFTDSGLTTGVTYYYKIVAYRTVNGEKYRSADSVIVSATP